MYIYKQGVTSSIYVYVILNFHYVKGFICLYGKGGKWQSAILFLNSLALFPVPYSNLTIT